MLYPTLRSCIGRFEKARRTIMHFKSKAATSHTRICTLILPAEFVLRNLISLISAIILGLLTGTYSYRTTPRVGNVFQDDNIHKRFHHSISDTGASNSSGQL